MDIQPVACCSGMCEMGLPQTPFTDISAELRTEMQAMEFFAQLSHFGS